MTNDDILPMIKNAAATYNLIGKYMVSFSGSGDSFDEFGESAAFCIHCEAEADYSILCSPYSVYSPVTKDPVFHKRKCPCLKDAALAAEFLQQAADVLADEDVKKADSGAGSIGVGTRNRWSVRGDLLFQIMDFDGRADFNNDGSSGDIIIDFKNLTIQIDVSVNEMVSSDLGANTYDSSTFDSEATASPKVDKVDIDALGDFKEWLGPAT